VFWQPKLTPQFAHPTREVEETTPGVVTVKMNSIPSPNQCGATENHNCSPETAQHHRAPRSCPVNQDQAHEGMANFQVNPEPFMPKGMNVEDWARPTRRRIIVTSNPPRRHDEYAIITVNPQPLQDQVHDMIEEVLTFIEEEHHIRIRSCCLSPLGLCLA
jgi:hypothetical protein